MTKLSPQGQAITSAHEREREREREREVMSFPNSSISNYIYNCYHNMLPKDSPFSLNDFFEVSINT